MGDRIDDPTATASFDLINQSRERLLYVKRVYIPESYFSIEKYRRTRFTYAASEYNKRIYIVSISSCAWIGHCTTAATVVILSGAPVHSRESTGAESKDLASNKI
jgi:hypothetical protein